MKVLEFIVANFEGISAIFMAAYALFKAFKRLDENAERQGKLDKMHVIKELVPYIHDLVEKSTKFTDTKKDDAFVDQMKKALVALGVNLTKEDEESVRILGAAQHNVLKGLEASVTVSETVKKPEEA